LKQLVRAAPSDITRLHALWTLDGLDAVDDATLGAALADKSQHVRAAAVRIAEPALAKPDAPVRGAVLKLVDDATPAVRRQLAASLGELPAAERESALATLTMRSGGDPVVADLVVSGLAGRERAFLERVLASSGPSDRSAATVRALGGALLRARDSAGVQQVLAWATEESRPRWQRLALLEGLQPPSAQFGFAAPGSPPAGERGPGGAGGAGAGGAGGAGGGAGARGGRGGGGFRGGAPAVTLAAALTYVRRSWGNTASPITPAAVQEVRGATAGRKKAWTVAELGAILR